jgi:hypothetical protein
MGWLAPGEGFDARDLSKLLKPYAVAPKKLRLGDETLQGYHAGWFQDSWFRYVDAYRDACRNTQERGERPCRRRS